MQLTFQDDGHPLRLVSVSPLEGLDGLEGPNKGHQLDKDATFGVKAKTAMSEEPNANQRRYSFAIEYTGPLNTNGRIVVSMKGTSNREIKVEPENNEGISSLP